MAEVRWTDPALADLAAVVAYISQDSPAAARRVALRLAAGDGLDIFPDRGRSIGGGLRELTTVYPYLIRYRHTAGIVRILEVRHGARKPDR